MTTPIEQTTRNAKEIASQFSDAWAVSAVDALPENLGRFVSDAYHWRGSRPFYEQPTLSSLCSNVIAPLRAGLNPLSRREYLSIASTNDADGGETIWTCSMGHLEGPFVEPWLGLRPTRKLVRLRYAEFHEVCDGRIMQSALLVDISDFLQQIDLDPFPNQRGVRHVFPPPLRALDHSAADGTEQGRMTMEVLNRMIEDLDLLNKSGEDTCTPEYLARCWHEDMSWYGPAGIGSMKTIPLYQEQHQFPFRQGLKNKQYHGHVARIAEGDFAAFFGWPNLTNSPRSGYLGLPESDVIGEMRVVDVYRREGDRLAENWVIIDFPHYFASFGIDLIANAVAAQSAEG